MKGREKYSNKLKESILSDAEKGTRDTSNASKETTSATNNASNETTNVTNSATTRSNDTYVYSVGILAARANGVYFLHITLSSLKIKTSSMKNRINHQNEFMSLKNLYNKCLVLIGKRALKTLLKMD